MPIGKQPTFHVKNRNEPDLPRLVARHRLHRSIFVFNVQLGQELRAPDHEMVPDIDPAPHPQRKGIVPPVSEHGSENVLAPFQFVRQIIARVEHLGAKARPGWVENAVRKTPAVQTELTVAQPDGV